MTTVRDVPIVDVDSHVAEPEDLWTARMPASLGDAIPKVVWDESAGESRWKVGDVLLSAVGEYCSAGWPEHFPSHPPTLADADPACFDAKARLERLDQYGVWAQVLYPNVIAFDAHAFLTELGPELATTCVEAYNDFLAEFAATDPRRLVPLMMLPFWDVEASVREMERCRALGHRGVLFAALFNRLGLPNIADASWAPVLSAAQDLELSMNFHIGFGQRDKESSERAWAKLTKRALAERTDRLAFVRKSAPHFASSAQAVSDVIMSGVCHRYPRLKFVSVESGFGYFPYLLENLDWLWLTSGAAAEYPERDRPSTYFHRQMYATFWHERSSVPLFEEFQDSLMFETDFPHETGLAPGPSSPASSARETVCQNLAGLSPEVLHKVVFANAASLYGLEPPDAS
ncbi:amidohydrolase family protein [Frankia sp. Cas4]|uniref:amidohydrolase family protein n=1 Tax=Frankia sp. Cas4 TaxID=3073927 RepID=UPI002AD287C8|nr:amidohydrolase family protein [Frankia sp. Cas4]